MIFMNILSKIELKQRNTQTQKPIIKFGIIRSKILTIELQWEKIIIFIHPD